MNNINININLVAFAEDMCVEIELLTGLFKEYCKEMLQEIEVMKEYYKAADYYMLERTVHNIKGVSANLEMDEMRKIAEIMDARLKENNNEDIDKYIEQMENIYWKTREAIIKAFEEQKIVLEFKGD